MDIKAALKSQYHAGLAMLKDAIERCPEELWLAGDHPRQYWRIAYHCLFFMHLYLQPNEQAFRRWELHRTESECLGNLPCPPFNTPQVVEPYTKQELLHYLAICDAIIDDVVDRLDLDAAECGFPWYQMNKLDHQLMNIRHLQQHVGQLSEHIYMAGGDLDWVGAGP